METPDIPQSPERGNVYLDPVCGASLDSPRDTERHYERTYRAAKQYSCDHLDCKGSFVTPWGLIRHIKNHGFAYKGHINLDKFEQEHRNTQIIPERYNNSRPIPLATHNDRLDYYYGLLQNQHYADSPIDSAYQGHRALALCEPCKFHHKTCSGPVEDNGSCADCKKSRIKCSMAQPLRAAQSPSGTAKRHWPEEPVLGEISFIERAMGAPKAPSSVDSSSSCEPHSLTTTAPSSYSSSSEHLQSFNSYSQRMPYIPPDSNVMNISLSNQTPPDSAPGSYSERYEMMTSPFSVDGYPYLPMARYSQDALADSEASSAEQSRATSPLRSPTIAESLQRLRHRDGQTRELEGSAATCTNCATRNTPLRIRNPEGQLLCNACGFFLKLHGVVRPLSIKADLAKKRSGDGEAAPTLLNRKPISITAEAEWEVALNQFKLEQVKGKTRPPTALSVGTLLSTCTEQYTVLIRRLDTLEKSDHGGMAGLMLSLSLSVVKLRLRLWGQIAPGIFDNPAVYYSQSLQRLVKINGITCELDMVVNTLVQDTQSEPKHYSREWEKVSRLIEELINLLNSLHEELPEKWRATTQSALVANLLVHQRASEISDRLRARVGGSAGGIFMMSLGPEVPRVLSSMFSLLENKNGTSAPMSYEYGLLNLNDLVNEGWFDPGIRVYVKRGSNGSPEKGLISVDVVACTGGQTPKQAMDSPSAMALQKRLQLHKPEEFRVLALAGYLENTAMRQVEILYQAPEWAAPPYSPISLFQLAAEDLLPVLTYKRIAIARKLACAVLYFHASGWIHGNIIDRNIIFFTARGTEAGINFLEPFLCNFALNPVKTTSKCGTPTANDLWEARSHDIYQLAWVILKLVLGEKGVHQLPAFDPTCAASKAEFQRTLEASVMPSLKQEDVVMLFKDAIMSCLSGGAALEGIIEQDEDFTRLAGYYWRVVRPLDHCLALLAKEMYPQISEQKEPIGTISHPLPAPRLCTHGLDCLVASYPSVQSFPERVSSNGALSKEDPHNPSHDPSNDTTGWQCCPNVHTKALESVKRQTLTQIHDLIFPQLIDNPKLMKRRKLKKGLSVLEITPIIKEVPSPPNTPKRSIDLTQKIPTAPEADKTEVQSIAAISPNISSGTEKKKVYPVQAAAWIIKLWQNELLPKLEKLLEVNLPKKESASIDLLGIGISRETSRPTIVITCQSVRKVKTDLRKLFEYDTDVFDLKIRKGDVRRSTGRRAREIRSIRRTTGSFAYDCPNRAYQQKPLSGASIGACLGGRPLPPGTYGGLILVDGLPYGMTVHHLLDPESEEESETDDDYALDEQEESRDSEESLYLEDESQRMSTTSTMSPSNTNVDSMPVYWDDSDPSDSESEPEDIADEDIPHSVSSLDSSDVGETSIDMEATLGDVGDIPGFPMNHNQDIVITQPAQFDVPDQGSFGDEQTIGNYKLGTILASSGIRRVRVGSEKHEMDWALVQIEQQRLVARNIIKGGGKYMRRAGPPDLEPCAIVPMQELSELRVHATGRTSGLQGGMISQAMSSVRLHGRETFSKSWHVVGNLGIPGDSGAWVVDNDNGRICGHVLARCSIKRVSYIIPMELLLEDIKATLGASSVRLPSVATEVDQLMGEAFAQYGVSDTSSNTLREMGRVHCPGPDTSPGGTDDITPLAY